MTDTTKRLAEDLLERALLFLDRLNHGVDLASECDICKFTDECRKFLYTAAQEANVQVEQIKAIAYIRRTFGHVLQPFVDIEKLPDGTMLYAAPHPTPAPASGDVTDAMVMAALGELDWDAVGDECKRNVMRAALEAATRARQGEGDVIEMRLCETTFLGLRPDQLYRFTVDESCPACVKCAECYRECRQAGTVAAPNAADAEAYRAVTLEDALHFAQAYDSAFQPLASRVLRALQSIGAVIPTAAPVAADDGEKKT